MAGLPVNYRCSHCQAELSAELKYVGQELGCPRCFQVSVVPANTNKPEVAKAALAMGTYAATRSGRLSLGMLTVPVRVSLLWNVIVGIWLLSWLPGSSFGLLAIGPMAIAVVEYVLLDWLTARNATASPAFVRTVGILEVLLGWFTFLPLVCGIIVLIHMNDVDLNEGKRIVR